MNTVDGNERNHIHDVLIIGGGSAGYTAALYAARAGMDTVVLERLAAGGQMALTEQIDNYPGFDEGVDGLLLSEKMRKGAERFGAKSRFGEVLSVELSQKIKRVETADGVVLGKTLILATGARPKELGVEGERELIGKGVSYCASCDGMFYQNKTVVVVGGGNSAAENALLLSRICQRVIIIHRRKAFRATKIYQDSIMQVKNITVFFESTVNALIVGERLTGVRLINLNTGEESDIDCDGVFVCIGRKPESDLVKGQLPVDGRGYIIADESTRTPLAGVFAVGDVRTKTVRQIVTAVADGAVAVHYAEEYLIEN